MTKPYHTLTPAELWQKYEDYKAGIKREPETVGEWKVQSKA